MEEDVPIQTDESPTYEEIMEFTKGKWPVMTEDERRNSTDQLFAELSQFRAERRAKEAQKQLRRSWENLCPPAYREISIERLPNAIKFQEVQKWAYGPKGLILIGSPRSGKTRSAWKLLERLHSEGRKIEALTPMDLKFQVMKAWQDNEAAEEWLDRLRRVGLLFLDDLDTVKFTEAVEETIYDIFEYRPMHHRPVIATLNRTGQELAARMNANGRGAKIVERMRESCEVINFGFGGD